MSTFFKRGQLSQLTGINLETIRYYENIGLLSKPQRAENGYRLFTQAHINELTFIKTCRSLGFSLDETKQLKDLQNTKPSHAADEIVIQQIHHIDEKIKQLISIKRTLSAISDCKPNERCKVMEFLTPSKVMEFLTPSEKLR